MSQENVEVVRELANAWRGDDRDAWLAMWDEAAEFYPCALSWRVVRIEATKGFGGS